jgi:hypothetical protein
VKFARPELEAEFRDELHPDVRLAIEELDEWCLENAIPQVVVVGLSREPAKNAAVGGSPNSWHLFGCAADLRNNHLRPEQRKAVFRWLQERCPRPGWECLDHDVGNGQHFHIARKDLSWRNTFAGPEAKA